MISTSRKTQPEDPAGTGLAPAGDGAMWWDPDFRAGLEEAGLDTFDAVMATGRGHCMRALEDRENWRLELPAEGSAGRRVFLKKHHVRSLGSRWQARFGGVPGPTPGRVEAENVRRLTAEGIGVMRLVAYGEKLRRNGLAESFVITEELRGFAPLDEFLCRRFAPPPRRSAPRDPDYQRLIFEVADVARRLHGGGFNHRDLYCCHFFVREPAPGRFEVRLIDLQRVQHRTRFRDRWLVKDLAQLAWSAPPGRVSCADRLRFVKHYLGVRRLRPRDKRLVRRVLAKQQFLARKLGEPR